MAHYSRKNYLYLLDLGPFHMLNQKTKTICNMNAI